MKNYRPPKHTYLKGHVELAIGAGEKVNHPKLTVRHAVYS